LALPLVPPAFVAPFVLPAGKPLLNSEWFPVRDEPLLSARSSWRASANVQRLSPEGWAALTQNGWYVLTDKIDPLYWVASPEDGDGPGRFLSEPFRAPCWVSLTVTGDLTRPGNELIFVPEGGAEHFPVRVRTEERFWRRVTCQLPFDWVGKPVRLAARADDRSPGNWFGFSSPRALGAGTVLAAQLKAVGFLPAFAAALLLFLLPGLVPAARLARGGLVAPALVLPLAVVFAGLAGSVTFWAYFLSPRLGVGFGAAVMLGSAAWLLAELQPGRAGRELLLSRDVLTPLALTALVGLFFVSLLFSVDLEVGAEGQPRLRFFEFTLAVDNEIPYFFADLLYRGRDARKDFAPHVPGWQSSDRPPLQAGLILLQMPLGDLLRQPRLYALAVGWALQCAWVPAAWSVWALAGLPRRRAGLALLFVVLTGFALVNTAFAWPKMLSAALAVCAVTLGLFDRGSDGQPLTSGKAVLLGLAAALATLGHGGVAFTLLPFGLLLLMPRWFPGISRLAAAAAVYVAVVYPWSLYQRYYDPPGSKLVKLHLAGEKQEGDTATWQSDRPVWRNVLRAYRQLSAGEILDNKLANVKTLFTAAQDQYPWPPNESPPLWPVDAAAFRRCDFLSLFWGLGLLNVGWIVALVRAWRRPAALNPTLGVTVPILCLASIAAWVVILFGPGATAVHQGSYATFLLLFASLAAWLATLPGPVPYVLLAAHATVFATGWLFTSPGNGYGLPNVFAITAAVVFLIVLLSVAVADGPAGSNPAPGTCSTSDSEFKGAHPSNPPDGK
jgi:hypothetical protein